LFRAGVNADLVSPETDLTKYKLVLAPDLILLPDEMAEKLNNYVKNGGVLLTDCRTGVKDETNLAHERTLPGLLSPMLGIEIEEYEAITPDFTYKIMSQDLFTGTYTAVNYCDWITPKGAEVKAGYDEWHLLSMAAVTRNSFGKGKGWYVGTIAKEEKFYDELMSSVIKDAGIDAYQGLPVGVEAIYRTGNIKTLLFLINHTEEPKNVPVPSGKTELITGKKTQGMLELGIYGVAVIEL
jgi:beta-galactosidase